MGDFKKAIISRLRYFSFVSSEAEDDFK